MGGRLSLGSDAYAGDLVNVELVVLSFKGAATLLLLSPGYYRGLVIEIFCKIFSSMVAKVLGKGIGLKVTKIRSINLIWSLFFFLFY